MAHQAGCRRVAGFGHYPGRPRGIRGPLRGSTRSERAGFKTTRQMGGEDAQRQVRVPVKRTPCQTRGLRVRIVSRISDAKTS